MRIFENAWFAKFADKQGITEGTLKSAVAEVEAGLVDADLGGGVFKKRLAREGKGKSGGYRVIVFFRSGERTFFIYGFEKSRQDNITPKELAVFRKNAKRMLAMGDATIEAWLQDGTLHEIKREAQHGEEISK